MYYKGFERTILVLSEDIVQRNRENLYKANREKSSFDSVFKFYSPPPERVLRIRRGKYIEWKDGILQLRDGRCLLSRISRKYLIYINAAFIFEILIIIA